MKKIILAILVFLMIGISAQAEEQQSLLYSVYDDKVTITGLSDPYISILVIPEKIEGYPVTKIDPYAFSETYLHSVTIPDTVEEIGDLAFFYSSNLQYVTLPEQDIKIGRDAFYGTALYEDSSYWQDDTLYIGKHLIASNNPNCVLNEGTLTIANEAFSDCDGLTGIVIPESVVRIGEDAFYNCWNLESVVIEEGAKYIGNYAFSGCNSLMEITLPDSVIEIGSYAFDGVPYPFASINSAAYIGNHLIWTEEGFSGTYTVKDGTCSIAANAFTNMDQSNLQNIVLPDTLKGIGEYAFYSCTGLKELKLPSSVEYIGEYAFAFCENLEKVTIPGGVAYIGDSAFGWCDNLNSVYTLNKKWNYQFDDSVRVFEGNSDLPFPIENSDDLYELSKAVNSGMNFGNIYFVLTNDIILNNNEWTPIGTYANPFSGNFDGKNYTISDYQITKVAGDYAWDGYTGFFGCTSSASIKNLNLSDFEINITNPEGNTYLGSFAGRTNNTILENCSAKGNIMLYNNTNTAYEADMGGIVAQCDYGSIISTSADCNIYYLGNETTSTGNTQVRLGGISAYTYSQIKNCTSNCLLYGVGLVYRAGGIAADNTYGGNVCISGCTANGKIRLIRNDTKDAILHCGGIAGFSRELIENSKSYVDIEICGNKTVSGELVTNSSDWNGWYCGSIFGVGYSGGNFKNVNNSGYGSVQVLPVPTRPTIESINLVDNKTCYQYTVMMECLEELSGTFVIALYSDNTLVGLQFGDINVDKKVVVVEGELTATKTPDLYKVFVWNAFSKLKPLTDVVSIKM